MTNKGFQNILLWAISAVLIFTPLARGTVRVWSIGPVELTLVSLIFCWLWRRTGAPAGGFSDKSPALILFACLAAISLVFSVYKHDSFFALLRLAVYIGFYYFLIHNADEMMFNRLFILVLVIGSGISVYGLLQYAGLLDHRWWIPADFLASTYVNHNHFAGYLELTIPLSFGYLLSRRAGSHKVIIALALVVMVTAFIVAQSRGGWICAGISYAVLMTLFIMKKRLRASSMVIFLLCVAAAFSIAYMNNEMVSKRVASLQDTAFNSRNREPSITTRILIWQGAIRMIRDFPLTGVGIGNFDSAFYRYRPEGLEARAIYAHNEYLQAAAESGILSGVLLLGILAAVVFAGLRVENNSVMLGAAAGVLSLSLHALVDFNFHIMANVLLLIVFIAYIKRYAKRRILCENPDY